MGLNSCYFWFYWSEPDLWLSHTWPELFTKLSGTAPLGKVKREKRPHNKLTDLKHIRRGTTEKEADRCSLIRNQFMAQNPRGLGSFKTVIAHDLSGKLISSSGSIVLLFLCVRLVLRISKTADLLWFSHTTNSTVYWGWSEKEKKNLVNIWFLEHNNEFTVL